jgi:uncharacterized repeat protein (TIGR03803 family)
MKTWHRLARVTQTAALFAALFLLLSGVASAQQAMQLLHYFGQDGISPHVPLFQANDGNFYSTSLGNGNTPASIFKMTPDGVVTVLHSFSAAGDGASPVGTLTQGLDGNLYGTTSAGGAFGKGTAYKIGLDGSGYGILHSFAGGPTDGDTPMAGLYQAVNDDHNFYGTTYAGGTANVGTVFRMTSAGSVTIVHSFSGTFDGANPTAPLIPLVTGTLAGTASSGGTAGLGTIFRMDNFTTSVLFSVIHAFVGGANDGANPEGIIQDTANHLFGVTSHGGSAIGPGLGTIFRVDMANANALTVVHGFSGGTDGAAPVDAPVQASDGSVYGVAQQAGSGGGGTIFQIVTLPDGTSAFTTPYSFVPGVTGSAPNGLLRSGVNLYGTTQSGGPLSGGTAFRLTSNARAALLSPTPGTALEATSVTFTWSAAPGAMTYWLEVGTTVGGHDFFGQGVGLVTSQVVSGLPHSGGPLYVRLWTQVNNSWQIADYLFTAYDGLARMTSPGPGSTLSGSTVTFNWTTGIGATAYWLDVGTAAGQADLFTQGTGSTTTQMVTGLPVLGQPIYVRLWTQFANVGWRWIDYKYAAATAKAAMTSPASGSVLTGTSVTFNWTAAAGASQYWLEVGTSAGAGDFFESSVGLALSQSVSGLPHDGSPVYVRLWTLAAGGAWLYSDYAYTGFSAKAAMTSPAPGAVLGGASVTFIWNAGIGASQYWLSVGTSAGAGDLFEQSTSLATSQTVNGLPVLGNPLYVRLWTLVSGKWLYSDYTYTAFNAKAVMTSPAPGSLVNSSSATFNWTAGTGATSYWLDVGTSPGSSNLFGQSVGLVTSKLVSGILTGGGNTIYVRLWTQLGVAWYFTDYVYAAVSPITVMTSPAPGSLLSASSVTFTWNVVPGAAQYWLDIGSGPGGVNLFSQSAGLSTNMNTLVIPMNGTPVYVRLWTLYSGVWRFVDYTYQTSLAADVTITFDGAGSNGAPFTTFTTSSFTVSVVSGSWTVNTSGGNPGTSIQFVSPINTNTSQTVAITPSAAPIRLKSFDIYTLQATTFYQIGGVLADGTTFLSGYYQWGPGPGWVHVRAPDPDLLLKQVFIAPYSAATPCCGNISGLDNIVVSQ